MDIPNGMHTEYTYDASGRQDSIHHKDGAMVKQGFDYTFDDGGSITRIDHEDGSYWEYDYDGRERLIEAVRGNHATPTIEATYAYTYDDADNMLTKKVPWYDDFEDGNSTGWSGHTTYYSVSVGVLKNTSDTTVRAAYFRSQANSEHGFDNIQLIAGTRSTTETFTYNDANEQLTHAKNGVTTTMTYDDWGRLATRDDGTHDATYAYRYGSMLYSLTSDFPGEGNVTYQTGGDSKRRNRVAGANETWYNYTVGFDVVSTENDANGSTGDLTMTNVVRSPDAQVSATLADLAGTTPSSGIVRYYAMDHLGSTRSVWSTSKAILGNYCFDPYGAEYSHTGKALDTLAAAYTGKAKDDASEFFHFPYRQYSSDTVRWTTPDPRGMVDGPNRYSYVGGNSLNYIDPNGQWIVVVGGTILILGGIYGAWSNADAIEDYLRKHRDRVPDYDNMDNDEFIDQLRHRKEFGDAARDAYDLSGDIGPLTPAVDLPGPDDLMDPRTPLVEMARDWCMNKLFGP